MRSVFFGPIVKLVIAIAVLLTFINDVGVVISSYYHADGEAKSIAQEAFRNYQLADSPDMALKGAQIKALQDGVDLTGFQVTPKFIRVAIEIPPRTTWVAHRVEQLRPLLTAAAQYDLQIH